MIASLVVMTMFASCDLLIDGDDDDGTFYDDDDDGGDIVHSTQTTGDAVSGGGTVHSTQTTGDAVSVKALAGSWYTGNSNESYYWAFDTDGRFAYYVCIYTPYNSFIVGSLPSVAEYYFQGKYRANGSVIENYDIQGHSRFIYGTQSEYFYKLDNATIAKQLLTTSLKAKEKIDNFSVKFEFINNMLLRIVIDRKNNDIYDWDFGYIGNSHNVTLPTHSIPAAAWPKNILPNDLPEYRKGRIRSVTPTSARYGSVVKITIDKTTRKDAIDYIISTLVRQEGWKSYTGIFGDAVQSEANIISELEKSRGVIQLHNKNRAYSAFFDVYDTTFTITF